MKIKGKQKKVLMIKVNLKIIFKKEKNNKRKKVNKNQKKGDKKP